MQYRMCRVHFADSIRGFAPADLETHRFRHVGAQQAKMRRDRRSSLLLGRGRGDAPLPVISAIALVLKYSLHLVQVSGGLYASPRCLSASVRHVLEACAPLDGSHDLTLVSLYAGTSVFCVHAGVIAWLAWLAGVRRERGDD